MRKRMAEMREKNEEKTEKIKNAKVKGNVYTEKKQAKNERIRSRKNEKYEAKGK